MSVPNYLRPYAELYAKNPREANKVWFDQARYGLFLHYGLYSLTGLNEWCQLREPIRVDEYAKLAESFTAEKFDAEAIVDFAMAAGMRYINITTRHHESFCLWEARNWDFHVGNSPAKRNLVQELYDACRKSGLGLFLYYSHGRDWKHPHAPNNDRWGGSARPEYDPPEPSYAVGDQYDLDIYIDWMTEQITDLISCFPEAAGIWLDGQAVPKSGNIEAFRIQELYDHIHALSPHMLVSYKQGIYGTEDFFAPEHFIPKQDSTGPDRAMIADYQKKTERIGEIGRNPSKKIEVCTTMIRNPVSWSWRPDSDFLSADEVFSEMKELVRAGANYLINTGLRGDGSLDPTHVAVLLAVGERLRQEGILPTSSFVHTHL
jgi:alpha-L-fucosidase